MIKEAEGQAEAVLKVQKANAEGLRMIKEAGADNAVLTLKSFEALAKVADGKSTKIIIPSELQNLAGLAASLKEVVVDEKDKKEMTAFAEAVREKLKSTAGSTKLLELSIRGNRPYRPYGTLPLKISVSSACEGCGTCIRKCPVQAISRTDAKVTDESACITCMRCIAVCPKHARKLGTLMTLAIRQKLKKVCTDRKDAEFVL